MTAAMGQDGPGGVVSPSTAWARPSFDFSLTPGRMATWLGGVFLLLLLAHLAGLLATHVLGLGRLFGLVHMFNFADEQNIPTLFATALFFFNSVLLALLARMTPPSRVRWTWLFLAVLLSLLALDEFAAIHERLSEPFRAWLDRERYGLLFFAWVLPYGIGVAFIGLIGIPALLSLSRYFRVVLVLSAILFITGAIGVEMLGGYYYELHAGRRDLTYGLITTVEESLEQVALIVSAYALLGAVGERNPEFSVKASLKPRSMAKP